MTRIVSATCRAMSFLLGGDESFVPATRVELACLAAVGFESTVYAIPPHWRGVTSFRPVAAECYCIRDLNGNRTRPHQGENLTA